MKKIKLNDFKNKDTWIKLGKIYVFLVNLIIFPGAIAYAVVEKKQYSGKVAKSIRIWAYFMALIITIVVGSSNDASASTTEATSSAPDVVEIEKEVEVAAEEEDEDEESVEAEVVENTDKDITTVLDYNLNDTSFDLYIPKKSLSSSSAWVYITAALETMEIPCKLP